MLLTHMQLFICAAGCSLFCKCEGRSTCWTVSLVQETEYDVDTDSDTISDNSDTDVSESDNCCKCPPTYILVLISTTILFMIVIESVRCLECISSHLRSMPLMGMLTCNKLFPVSLVLVPHKIQHLLYEHGCQNIS